MPTVVNGKFLTPDGKKPRPGSPEEKAMFKRARQYYERTGQHLGIFDNPKNADAAATRIHNRPDPRYKSGSPKTPDSDRRRKAQEKFDRLYDESGVPQGYPGVDDDDERD